MLNQIQILLKTFCRHYIDPIYTRWVQARQTWRANKQCSFVLFSWNKLCIAVVIVVNNFKAKTYMCMSI